MDVKIYGRKDVWTKRRMDLKTYGRKDVWTKRHMDVKTEFFCEM